MNVLTFSDKEMDDQRLEKWRSILEDRIKPEVLTLMLHRQVFWRIREIAQGNPDLPASYFIAFFQETYFNSQAVGVRRLADTGKQPLSLLRLLAEVQTMSSQFTVDWFIELSGPEDEHEAEDAHSTFRERFAGATESHLDPVLVGQVSAALSRSVKPIRSHVDTSLAHIDKSPSDIPTFAELHRAIDAVSQAFRLCFLLMTSSDIVLDKIPIGHDWEQIFTVPWMEAPAEKWRREQGL